MKDLLKSLRDNNILLEVADGELKIFTKQPHLKTELIDEIRQKKEELIRFLAVNDQADFKDSFKLRIPAVASQVSYPLSAAQRRLWILCQLEESSAAYNIPGFYEFDNALNPDALAYAFDTIIARHESLRTVFKKDEQGDVRQYILWPKQTGFEIVYTDLRDDHRCGERFKELVKEVSRKTFDLANGPLLRANLFRTEDSCWIFCLVMHHIISDGWSMGVLINELLLFYDAYLKGQPELPSPLRIQYRDYAVWQEGQLTGAALQTHKAYWLQHFEGGAPVLELPGDKVRPAIKTYGGAVIRGKIDKDISNEFKAFCERRGGTLFMGLLAAVDALLYKYTGQEDIVIGSPMAGRDHIDLEDQIGFYVNTMAFRSKFSGEDSYRQLFDNVRAVTLGAYEHRAFPFDELVDELHLQRDISRNPLFDVQVIVQNAEPDNRMEIGGQPAPAIKVHKGIESDRSVFDMVIYFLDTGEGLETRIVYNNDVCSEDVIGRLADHIGSILAAVMRYPDMALCRLDLLTEKEKERLFIEFNGDGPVPQNGRTLVQLFREQAAKTADNTAVLFSDKRLTYRQLDDLSDRLASYLQRVFQPCADDLIGVMMDRSEKMVIAILGVLKSGAAYVPIDPTYPQARKEFIIKDAGLNLLITETVFIFDLTYYKGSIFAIDAQLDTLDDSAGVSVMDTTVAGDLAYIIYTSGSTGEPKGVMIEHGAAANSVGSLKAIFDIKAGERCLQFASMSFDVSVFEIFTPLISGASVCIISDADKKLPSLLENFLVTERIDIAAIPPAFVKLLSVEKLSGLKKLVTGGELIGSDTIAPFTRTGIYFNAYGPTETCIAASVFKVGKGEKAKTRNLPIGRPIRGTEIYILTEQMDPAPVWVTGEICIGGAGLARGYLNQPELTEEKFVSHPLHEGKKIYRTGDMGRWLPDGNVEFIGRKDNQVKIRGYRIEPAEIENALYGYRNITSAAVVARSRQTGETELVAYLVSEEPVNMSGLRSYLNKILPAYMVPGQYVQLFEMPLTTNDKIDRKALPDPSSLEISTGIEYAAPKNETEQTLVRIWEKILGKEKIGIRSSFFDLGGDSIKILRMTTEVRKELAWDIPIGDIYKHNTIEEIIQHVLQNKEEIDRRNNRMKEYLSLATAEIVSLKERILTLNYFICKDDIEDIYPMSDIEKGMVYESLLSENITIYHDQIMHRKVFVDFDIHRFRLAVKLLTDKHSILRTSFNLNEFETEVQIVNKKVDVQVRYDDLCGLARSEQEIRVRDFMSAELQHPFELSVAPLWRMSVFNLGRDEVVFVFQTHHAIIDGWSDASYVTELNNLYLRLKEEPLYIPEKLKADYRVFVIRQEAEKKIEEVRDFWQKELSDHTRLDLFAPEDEYATSTRVLAGSQLEKLERLALDLNTTVKSISLGAYLYMLGLLSYGKELTIGLVSNNRLNCEDGDNILGCFLNTIPLKVTIDDRDTCSEWIVRVHDKLIALKDFEGLSFMEISRIHNRQQNSGNLFFDTLFNYIDFHTYKSIEQDVSSHHKEAVEEPFDVRSYGRTNTHLDFSIDVTGEGYTMGLRLTRKLKSGFSAGQVCELYFKILTHIINSPQRTLSGMEILDEAERHRLLVLFNDTTVDYPGDRSVTALFEEQVSKAPDKIALVFGDRSLTYWELNERSNRLADYLRRQYGIGRDQRVGVRLERSDWLMIAILGILKSGGAYVPLHPGYPEERIAYMQTDSGCKLVIDERELGRFLGEEGQYSGSNGENVNGSRDLAYVMYTSGTTGRPKGVMVEHRGVVRLLRSTNYMCFSGEEVLLSTGAISFDSTTFEYWGMLLNGGRLIFCSQDVLLDGDQLGALIRKERVDTMFFTSGWLNQLINKDIELFRGLQTLLTGGDALSVSHIKLLRQCYPDLKIINAYGPTENTAFSLCHEIGEVGEIVPVGRPISNSTAYILDERLQLCPVGITGEICVGGDGLARGYINQAELTAEKFVGHPFKEGERLYRTGDLGRWLPDGTIAFGGRKDDQVKIRGYRVEPGEVEEVLRTHPAVEAAAVAAVRGSGGDRTLTAYVVSKETLQVVDLRSWLGTVLPSYMIPGKFVQLAALPLTPAGKIDRKRLPEGEDQGMKTGVEYIAPRNETEEKLVSIWRELLGVEQIGIKDNFFELGGHSLMAMRLLALIHKEFNVKIRLGDMFNKATIEEIGKNIVREVWIRKSKEEYSLDLVSGKNFIL